MASASPTELSPYPHNKFLRKPDAESNSALLCTRSNLVYLSWRPVSPSNKQKNKGQKCQLDKTTMLWIITSNFGEVVGTAG